MSENTVPTTSPSTTRLSAQPEAQPIARLIEWAEKITKLSAVIGIFGYMSLRAHWNYLGISCTSFLGTERYLMEAYPLLTSFFLGPGTFMGLLIVMTLLLMLFKGTVWLLRTFGYSTNFLISYWNRPATTMLLVLAMGSFYLRVLQHLNTLKVVTPQGEVDKLSILIGPLSSAKLEAVDFQEIFLEMCVVCLLGYILLFHYSRVREISEPGAHRRFNRILWGIFAFLLTFVSLSAPIVYGYGVRSTRYFKVQIVTDANPPRTLQGILVLETAEQLTLWQARSGLGTMITIPRGQIRTETFLGDVDLLEEARHAIPKAASVALQRHSF